MKRRYVKKAINDVSKKPNKTSTKQEQIAIKMTRSVTKALEKAPVPSDASRKAAGGASKKEEHKKRGRKAVGLDDYKDESSKEIEKLR